MVFLPGHIDRCATSGRVLYDDVPVTVGIEISRHSRVESKDNSYVSHRRSVTVLHVNR